jgi:hypothetical protein
MVIESGTSNFAYITGKWDVKVKSTLNDGYNKQNFQMIAFNQPGTVNTDIEFKIHFKSPCESTKINTNFEVGDVSRLVSLAGSDVETSVKLGWLSTG